MSAEEVIDAWLDPCGSDTGAGILNALKAAGFAVVQLPTVAFKGPHDTDASMFRVAAKKAETYYPVGGSNVGHAVALILLQAADAAEDTP